MNDVLVIARREVAEKRLIFVAAAAFALISLIIPFVPGVHGSPREIIALTSGFLALGFMLGAATLLGGNIVGRDITAGRMSFYFARPVSGAAIWFGKVAASLLLIVASYVIVALPSFFAATRSTAFRIDGVQPAAVFAGFAAALFIVGHSLTTMVRSRSFLIAIDFGAAAATALFGWLIVRPLFDGVAFRALRLLAWSGGTALVVAFIAAGTWQLTDGRTDRRRSHAAFSKVLWSVIGAFLLIAGAFSAWVASTSPADMDGLMVESSAANMALISGRSTRHFDYAAKYLLNTANGDVERIGGAWTWEGEVSRDGSTLVARRRTTYYRNDLGEIIVRGTKPGSPLLATSIMAGGNDVIAVSDDGSRIAVAQQSVVNVYDVAQRRSLGSVRLDARPNWMFFTTPGSLRIYTQSVFGGSLKPVPRTIAMYEYDTASRTLRRGGSMTVEARYVRLEANADDSRVIVSAIVSPESAMTVLCDGRTLQTIATLPRHRLAVFLRDGRLALVARQAESPNASLTVTDANGTPQRTIDLGKWSWLLHAAETAPGVVVIDMAQRDSEIDYRVIAVNVDHGVIREQRDLATAAHRFTGLTGDPRSLPESPAQLMVTKEKSLVSWNALTGEKKTLVAMR